MNFAEYYANAIRYGRAPADGIEAFVKADTEHGILARNNTPAAVFADFLEDHDDPRHEIVRQDVATRNRPEEYYDNSMRSNLLERAGLPINEVSRMDLLRGNTSTVIGNTDVYDVTPITHRSSGKIMNEVRWWPRNSKLKHKANYVGYIGHFTPEETDDLFRRMGVQLHPGPDSAERE